MYACLDLGSNSFHLLIACVGQDGMEVIERSSEKVQLGEGVTASGRIAPGAFQRGVDCLCRFREVIDRYPVDCYWALGTNALEDPVVGVRLRNLAVSLVEHVGQGSAEHPEDPDLVIRPSDSERQAAAQVWALHAEHREGGNPEGLRRLLPDACADFSAGSPRPGPHD